MQMTQGVALILLTNQAAIVEGCDWGSSICGVLPIPRPDIRLLITLAKEIDLGIEQKMQKMRRSKGNYRPPWGSNPQPLVYLSENQRATIAPSSRLISDGSLANICSSIARSV